MLPGIQPRSEDHRVLSPRKLAGAAPKVSWLKNTTATKAKATVEVVDCPQLSAPAAVVE
jgi:hypothetical protein